MNNNYCGIFKVTEENRLDPEGSETVIGRAIIEGPIDAAEAGAIIVRAVDSTRKGLRDMNFIMGVEIIEELSSIPDNFRGVLPVYEDGDTKVWLINP